MMSISMSSAVRALRACKPVRVVDPITGEWILQLAYCAPSCPLRPLRRELARKLHKGTKLYLEE